MFRRIFYFSTLLILLSYTICIASEFHLSRPQGLCYDAQGQLYVADTGNHRVLLFDSELEPINAIGMGRPGREAGEFSEPMDVAVDSTGRIIVADARNHRIQVFSSGLEFQFQFGNQGKADGEFSLPAHITVDDNDHIIVTDRFNHRLQVFDKDGKHVFTLANRTGAKTDEEIQAFREYAIQQNKNPDEVKSEWQITNWGQLNEPGAVFFDAKLRRLFVANGWNCRIEILDYDSATGIISRRDFHSGVAWGFWINRGCVGDAQGRLYGVQSAWGIIRIFLDRSRLNQNTNPTIDIESGTYGMIKELNDIAISPLTGDVAITDGHNNRIIVYNKDFDMPDSPRVPDIASDGATIQWHTAKTCETIVQLRNGKYPFNTPGYESSWTDDDVMEISFGDKSTTEHEAKLTGLKSATRYYYRLRMPELRTLPGKGWSREYAINTLAADGETAFLRIPIRVLLLANVIKVDSIKGLHEDVKFPEPMSDEDIKRYYKDQWEEVKLFYWNNSSMKYWIDYDFYIDHEFYKKGAVPDEADDRFRQLKNQNHDSIFRQMIAEAGREKKVYFGSVVCEAERRWDAHKQEWVYSGSGGGTYGVEWPTPGRTHFLGGSDVAWLMCHEFKHQIESQYNNSGLNSEDDRLWFCHFSPKYSNPDPAIGEWKWDTASDHGEHWDGIAWQMRNLSLTQYMRNMFGHIEAAKDTDGDGIPDNALYLPFDEERFGSDSAKIDTDGDGLTDMEEILASRWHTAMLTNVRQRVSSGHLHPDPNNSDSDGDGLPDGEDSYPIYPFRAEIPAATVKIDGDLADWSEKQHLWLKREEISIGVDIYVCYDDAKLFYAIKVDGKHNGITLITDNNADGFYYGNDNIYVEIRPDGTLQNVRMHMSSGNRWPYFDNNHEILKVEDIEYANNPDGDIQIIELAFPGRADIGLNLESGSEIGLMFYVKLKDSGQISLFEPYHIYDSKFQ